MNRSKMKDRNYLLRHVEGLIEVGVMTLLYYLMWKFCHRDDSMLPFHGRGKLVLMLVYALLVLLMFAFSECFKFGILRFSDVVLSSWISLILINIISYFQICLMSGHMVSVIPILLLIMAEYLTSAVLCFSYTALYYKINPPHDMILISGGANGLTVKKKIDRRDDKYLINESIQLEDLRGDEALMDR